MRNDDKAHVAPDDPTNPFFKDGTVDYDRMQGNNPLAGGEYPKALYRAGGSEDIHGHMVDTATVNSEDEEEAYVTEGWRTTPAKAAALGKALLEEEAKKPDPKDEEIERLKAALAAAQQQPDSERRGPGRPRKEAIAPEPEPA